MIFHLFLCEGVYLVIIPREIIDIFDLKLVNHFFSTEDEAFTQIPRIGQGNESCHKLYIFYWKDMRDVSNEGKCRWNPPRGFSRGFFVRKFAC